MQRHPAPHNTVQVTMELNQIDPFIWEVPKTGGMRVPGRIYSSSGMISRVSREEAFKQVANVAHLPGIVTASLAMPDIHWGYGFPIGGVAAFDWHEGIISPGGVGYDINCGVRLSGTSLEEKDVKMVIWHKSLVHIYEESAFQLLCGLYHIIRFIQSHRYGFLADYVFSCFERVDGHLAM